VASGGAAAAAAAATLAGDGLVRICLRAESIRDVRSPAAAGAGVLGAVLVGFALVPALAAVGAEGLAAAGAHLGGAALALGLGLLAAGGAAAPLSCFAGLGAGLALAPPCPAPFALALPPRARPRPFGGIGARARYCTYAFVQQRWCSAAARCHVPLQDRAGIYFGHFA
jgi:hypothetical protein